MTDEPPDNLPPSDERNELRSLRQLGLAWTCRYCTGTGGNVCRTCRGFGIMTDINDSTARPSHLYTRARR